jgi:DNA polymerase-3 subunit gamma/tau
MSYQVIARRWRPQSFNEVISQDHISKTLQNSIERGRISHAYIFAGPRGVGKTTSARIFAKSLNCVNGPTPSPCGVCENCVEIKNGESFDVIEIDGASNNSVDDIRELRERVSYAPVKGRYKVYIIDEVHMLSGAAFNALLKTLEEPPAHVIFILATTEIHKLPDTIISRCQKYVFRKIPVDAIASHLVSIVKKEGSLVEEKALYAVARAAEGSMRDAQSLLEQIMAISTGEVTEREALAQLGIVPLQSYNRILRGISSGSAGEIVDEANLVVASGADAARYVAGLADVIRAMRLISNGVSIRDAAGYSADEMNDLDQLKDSFHDEELSAFHRRCVELQSEIRYVQNDCAAIEMALLDMMAIKKRPSLAAILSKLDEAKGVIAQTPVVQTVSHPQSAAVTKPAPLSVIRSQPSPVESKEEEIPLPSDDEITAQPDLSEYDKEHPVIDKIKDMFHGEIVEKKK